MNKEVICVDADWDIELYLHGLAAPKKNEVCTVVGVCERGFYYLKGYGNQVSYNPACFADITGMHDEINEALKASTPAPVPEVEPQEA